MEIFSNKGSAKSPLSAVQGALEPLLIAVKTGAVKQNYQYIESASKAGPQFGNSHDDDRVAQRSFLDTIRNTKHYPNTNAGDIKYPHNLYSIYTPVNAELEIDDQFVRTFPVLKKYKDDINTQAKAEFYSMISKIMNVPKESANSVWRSLIKKWVWEVDMAQSVVYYHLLLKVGYQAILQLKEQNNSVEIGVIEEHLERFTRLFQQNNSLKKNTQFSIDAKEQINEVSIVKTTKQLFCGNCLIYDCHKHKLQDHIIQEHNQFIHPKNKPNPEKKIQTATKLLNHYYKYCTEPNQMDEQLAFNKDSCSSTCYLYLRKDKFQELRYQLPGLLSPSIRALINLGIQMVAYSPCHVSLIAKSKMSCSLVFWYFVKVLNIQQCIQRNFASQMDYLMSINISSARGDEKKKKNKKNQVKKKQNIKQTAHSNLSSVTPICFHSFLHKEDQDVSEPCTNCSCSHRGFCLPTCLCDARCPIRIKGCSCLFGAQGQKKKGARGQNKPYKQCDIKTCPCLIANRECDPVVCHGCYPEPSKDASKDEKRNKYGIEILCTNNQYQLQQYPKLKLGLSTLPGGGLGLFAGQFIKQNSIIGTYTGQNIENSLEETRQRVANDTYFYNFQFNQGSIDAKFFGNKARFINHDNRQLQNCYPKIKFGKSDNFLAVYASRNINKDEELFFDYDGDGTLFKNYKDKYPFIKERLKTQKH